MPIRLRQLTFNFINEHYKKEQEEYDKVSGKGKLITETTAIAKPNIPQLANKQPTYTSRVSKK
jgi:hypothetical protein